MKIAIIFLCLGIASFIGTSKGTDIKVKTIDVNKADYHARCIQSIALKVEIVKSRPDAEKRVRLLCLLEDLLYELKILSIDLECTLNEVCKLLELPLDIIECLLAEDLEALLEKILNDVDVLLSSLLDPLVHLVEGLLAKVGCLLKTLLETLNNQLGSETGLLSLLSGLGDSLSGVLDSLVGTVLGGVLGGLLG